MADQVKQVTGWRVTSQSLRLSPASDWNAELAHQARTVRSAARCLDIVVDAYARAIGEQPESEGQVSAP